MPENRKLLCSLSAVKLAALFASVAACICLYLIFHQDVLNGFFQSKTVFGYLLTILVYIVIALAAYLFVAANKPLLTNVKCSPIISAVLSGSVTVLAMLLAVNMLLTDDGKNGADVSTFFWHRYSIFIIALAMFSLAVCIFAYLSKNLNEHQLLRFVLLIFLGCIYASSTVYFNVFAGDLYHIDAFMHPIYNIYYHVPYSQLSYGIYGHYELLYVLPMLVFGLNPLVICFTHWIVSFLLFWLVIYIACSVVKNKKICLLTAVALIVPTACMFQSSSYQTTPHRVFFGVLLIAYVVWAYGSSRFKQDHPKLFLVFGNIICCLSLLCSLESGAVCSVAWIFVLFKMDACNYGVKPCLRGLVRNLALVAVDLLFAIVVVNIYNLFVGGGFIFSEFFYPYTNSTFLSHYSLGMFFGNYPYVYLTLLGLGCCLHSMSRTCFFDMPDASIKSVVFGFAGAVLLGQLAYFYARSAYYGLLIAVPVAVILISIIFDSFLNRFPRYGVLFIGDAMGVLDYVVTHFVGCITLLVFSFALLASFSLPKCMLTAIEAGKYRIVPTDDELTRLSNDLPSDTYAFGWGTDEVLGLINRESRYHYLGTTDALVDVEANSSVVNRLNDDLQDQDSILVNDAVGSFVPSQFHLVCSYNIFGNNFSLYSR